MGFVDAVMTGQAPDGGLLLPESIPDVTGRLPEWRRLSYPELASEVLGLFTDISPADRKNLAGESYAAFDTPDVAPSRAVDNFYVLELFHGPTLSFKDIALQMLGRLFERILTERGGELNILAATSGDTGSAAIHGVRGRDRMRIFVMHPRGRISKLQELQMTTVLDANVFNIAVDGSFDDCQKIMKTIFSDLEFKEKHSLGAVNSINWARVMAQVVYYFYAAFRVMETTGASSVRFAVPTGNFGDVFAGYVAARMGLPVDRLVLATNENDILARFFASGEYRLGSVRETVSPAMDIQVASNFERYLYYRTGGQPSAVEKMMHEFADTGCIRVAPGADGKTDGLIVGGTGKTADTLSEIRDVYKRTGYLLDPHTAVGVHVARKHMSPGIPMICLSTAHPAKFPEAIERATGENAARHRLIAGLTDLPAKCTVLPSNVGEIRRYMESSLGPGNNRV